VHSVIIVGTQPAVALRFGTEKEEVSTLFNPSQNSNSTLDSFVTGVVGIYDCEHKRIGQPGARSDAAAINEICVC